MEYQSNAFMALRKDVVIARRGLCANRWVQWDHHVLVFGHGIFEKFRLFLQSITCKWQQGRHVSTSCDKFNDPGSDKSNEKMLESKFDTKSCWLGSTQNFVPHNVVLCQILTQLDRLLLGWWVLLKNWHTKFHKHPKSSNRKKTDKNHCRDTPKDTHLTQKHPQLNPNASFVMITWYPCAGSAKLKSWFSSWRIICETGIQFTISPTHLSIMKTFIRPFGYTGMSFSTGNNVDYW